MIGTKPKQRRGAMYSTAIEDAEHRCGTPYHTPSMEKAEREKRKKAMNVVKVYRASTGEFLREETVPIRRHTHHLFL